MKGLADFGFCESRFPCDSLETESFAWNPIWQKHANLLVKGFRGSQRCTKKVDKPQMQNLSSLIGYQRTLLALCRHYLTAVFGRPRASPLLALDLVVEQADRVQATYCTTKVEYHKTQRVLAATVGNGGRHVVAAIFRGDYPFPAWMKKHPTEKKKETQTVISRDSFIIIDAFFRLETTNYF